MIRRPPFWKSNGGKRTWILLRMSSRFWALSIPGHSWHRGRLLSCCWNNGRKSDKSRRTGCVVMIGFPVGLLHFSLLSNSSRRSVLRTAQAIQQCGSTESNWTDLVQTESPENFMISLIFEILPTDKEWKSNEITYCRPWTSCGFHSSSWIFVHIDYTRTRTLKLCFVLPNKIRISPFQDRLNYFLHFSQVILRLLADVAYQMYRAHHYLSGFLSCTLIIALSMWSWNSRDRAAFKDNLQASFLAVCCSTLSCNSGCKSVASRASFFEELSKHWSCSGSEGQFTGLHIDHSFLASDVR